MRFRLNSLGLKLNLALLLFFLVVGFATALFLFFGFDKTKENATTRSREGLEELGQQQIRTIASDQATLGALQLEWASDAGQMAARYLAETFRSGASSSAEPGSLTRNANGILYDASPQRRSDIVMPNFVELTPATLADVNESAALDAIAPAIFTGYTGRIRGEGFDATAFFYSTVNQVHRYFPSIGLQSIAPPDIDISDRLRELGPEMNPERRTVWSEPYEDRAGQGVVVTAYSPVYDEEVFKGYIGIDLSIVNLIAVVNGVKPTQSGFGFYVDRGGSLLRTDAHDLLAFELESQDNEELAATVARMKAGESGVDRVTIAGEDFFIGYFPVREVGGSFAVAAPVSEITEQAAEITAEIETQADQTMTIVLTSMAALFAIALVGATYLNRRVLLRPIEALVSGTRAVAAGDFETQIAVRGDDELSTLGHSFNQMTTEILQRAESLRQEVRERQAAQEELRALFAAMTDRVIVFDRDGRVMRLPKTNAVPIKVAPEDLPGMTLRDIMPEDQAQPVLASIRQALKDRATVTEEYPYVVGDRTYWFLSAFSPISQDEVVMVARDITDRMNARQELERQVRERTQELQTLLNVSRNVASTLELGPLLETIIEQLKDIADFNRCSIFELEGDTMVVLDSRANFTEMPLDMRVPTADLGPIWERMSRGEAVFINDVHDSSLLAQAYRHAVGARMETYPFQAIHSALGAPLTSKDRIIGMLVLSHMQPAYYNERHAGLVTAIATQIAVAIENARLYGQAQQLAAVEERQRLARELHDSVSQALYGIALGARTARTLLDRDPSKVAEPVDYVLSLAEAGLAEMRALIFELRPESLEIEGLVAALDKQIAATAARYGIEVTSELAEEPEMSLAQKEIFYRIGQEALHNVVKHARASRAMVRFARNNGSYVLEVADNGVGFDAGQSFPGHMGLVSMSERALSIGAELEVESAPGKGTVVKLRAAAG